MDASISVNVLNTENLHKQVIEDLSDLDTVDTLKHKIEKAMGVPKEKQRLVMGRKELSARDMTLRDLKIQKGASLQILIKETPSESKSESLKPGIAVKVLNISTLSKTEISGLLLSSTVLELKKKIQDESGFAPSIQRLMLGRKELEPMEATLESFGVKNGSSLQLALKEESAGTVSTQALPVDASSTTSEVISAGTMQSSPAPEEEITVSILNISSLSKCFVSGLKLTSTIADLKVKIEAETGVKTSLQRLILAGKELSKDDMLLSATKIRNGITLQLALKEQSSTETPPSPAVTSPNKSQPKAFHSGRSSASNPAGKADAKLSRSTMTDTKAVSGVPEHEGSYVRANSKGDFVSIAVTSSSGSIVTDVDRIHRVYALARTVAFFGFLNVVSLWLWFERLISFVRFLESSVGLDIRRHSS
jgi:hypothetical protein